MRQQSSHRFTPLFACVAVSVTLGCGGQPSPVQPPDIVAQTAAAAALEQYDADKDGALADMELEQCPGILRAIRLYDLDNDGRVSGDEIANRIRVWREIKLGLMSMICVVTMDGRPLNEAQVKLIPEKFLGNNIKTATGTMENGTAILAIADADLPPDQQGLVGVHIGVYKVEITHPSQSIPTKYNTETMLGFEVAQDNPELQNLVFNISSR